MGENLIQALLIITMLIVGLLPGQPVVPAQVSVNFSRIEMAYTFGERLTFSGEVTPADQIKELYLFLQPTGSETRLQKLTLDAKGRFSAQHDLTSDPLRPFALTRAWLRATLQSGVEVESRMEEFYYDDNRFAWQELTDDTFSVHWYAGDLSTGQTILDAARSGLKSASAVIPVDAPRPLRIFVYESAADLQTAMQLTSQPWIAGHASPDLGVVLITAPQGPDQLLELSRQIPHELTHILQYSQVGDAYARVPVWLSEGMASLAENYANADYQRALTRAVETQSLLPIAGLCASFPREASGAFLSYAQADSFTGYLQQKFGTSALLKLIIQYKDGLGCEEGVARALGQPLSQLEAGWKQETLGINASLAAWRNLLPYLILITIVLIPPAAIGAAVLRHKRKPQSVEHKA